MKLIRQNPNRGDVCERSHESLFDFREHRSRLFCSCRLAHSSISGHPTRDRTGLPGSPDDIGDETLSPNHERAKMPISIGLNDQTSSRQGKKELWTIRVGLISSAHFIIMMTVRVRPPQVQCPDTACSFVEAPDANAHLNCRIDAQTSDIEKLESRCRQ